MANTINPINVAQINAALVTYANDTQVVAGLTELKAILTDENTKPYRCSKCGGVGTVTKDDYDNTIPAVYCDLCNGDGVTSAIYIRGINRATGKDTYTLPPQ